MSLNSPRPRRGRSLVFDALSAWLSLCQAFLAHEPDVIEVLVGQQLRPLPETAPPALCIRQLFVQPSN